MYKLLRRILFRTVLIENGTLDYMNASGECYRRQMLSSTNLLNFSGKSFDCNRLTHVTPCMVSVKYLLIESTKFEMKIISEWCHTATTKFPSRDIYVRLFKHKEKRHQYSLLLFTSWHDVSHIMWLSYSLIYSVTHSLHSDPLRNSITCTWIRNGNRIEWSSIWSVIMLVLTNGRPRRGESYLLIIFYDYTCYPLPPIRRLVLSLKPFCCPLCVQSGSSSDYGSSVVINSIIDDSIIIGKDSVVSHCHLKVSL